MRVIEVVIDVCTRLGLEYDKAVLMSSIGLQVVRGAYGDIRMVRGD